MAHTGCVRATDFHEKPYSIAHIYCNYFVKLNYFCGTLLCPPPHSWVLLRRLSGTHRPPHLPSPPFLLSFFSPFPPPWQARVENPNPKVKQAMNANLPKAGRAPSLISAGGRFPPLLILVSSFAAGIRRKKILTLSEAGVAIMPILFSSGRRKHHAHK